jgi:hypothetical protein
VRRVPVVVLGETAVAQRFSALVEEVRTDLAGFEGFMLDLAAEPGPEPSVVVDTGGGYDALLAAVHAGHAAATADLASVVRHPVDLAVLLADRRLGLSGALLPGLPLVEVLTRCIDAGDPVREVTIDGADPEALADEAVAVSFLLGVELGREHIRVEQQATTGTAGSAWRAVLGPRFPSVIRHGTTTGVSGIRTATVRATRTEVTLTGPAADPARIAGALLADVLGFAREGDRPWRAHRRRVTRVS